MAAKKDIPKPEPTAVVVTPSGIEIAYWSLKTAWHRKTRWYEIRKGPKGRWREVPSVTTVLDVLDKPGLTWWGMRMGIEGMLTLFSAGMLQAAKTPSGASVLACAGPEGLIVAGLPQAEALMLAAKLDVNNVRDKAGDRGNSIHDAFELWAKEGILPEPDLFPPHERGYAYGLLKFIEESGAIAHYSEVQIGSHKHGFAGRYDIRIEYPQDVELVVHHTPVRGAKRAVLTAGLYLDDLKTSKDVYDKHFKQLEAYEEGSIECGYDPTDGRGVIHVDAEGNYKRVPSPAVFRDFKTTLDEWKSQQALKRRWKESK